MTVDLDELRSRVVLPDQDAADAAKDRQRSLIKPAGSLGRLEEVAAWFASVQGGCPPHELARARVVVFAGDHGVAEAGVSAYPREVTAQLVRAIGKGAAAVNVLARKARATVRVVDMAVAAKTPPKVSAHKIGTGSGRIDREDALGLEDTERAFAAGVAIADEEVDAGTDLLIPGDVGVGNTTHAAVLIAASLGLEPTAVTGRGSGLDDAGLMRKLVAVRDGLRRAREHRYDPMRLLACAGGADFAAMAGFLVEAAVRQTPVLLDGVVSAAAALVARDIVYDAALWWFAAHTTNEPAHKAVLDSLRLEPLLDLGVRAGGGSGALVALPIIRQAIAALAEMATYDEAGITPP